MLVVGLTGGIGAGKSTFAALLAERGAQIIDADHLGRHALRPGERSWHSIVSQFGEEILAAGGLEIDRKRLASIVFSDPGKLAALNAIVHPVILGRIADELDRLRSTDAIVVIDAALIVELGLRDSLDVLIAVIAPEATRSRWLQTERSMDPIDIRARMAAQSDPEVAAREAEIVVRNDGSLEDLVLRADQVWAELRQRVS